MATNQKANAQRIHSLGQIEALHKVSTPFLAIVSMTVSIRDQNELRHRGKAVFVDRKSNRVTRWFVLYENKWYPVVYDSKRKEIITILPDEALGPPPDRPQ